MARSTTLSFPTSSIVVVVPWCHFTVLQARDCITGPGRGPLSSRHRRNEVSHCSIDNVSRANSFCFFYMRVRDTHSVLGHAVLQQGASNSRRPLELRHDWYAEAMDWVCQYRYEQQAHFFPPRDQIPSFGRDINGAIKEYLNSWEIGCEPIIAGNFENRR